jgi:hypothetical protein
MTKILRLYLMAIPLIVFPVMVVAQTSSSGCGPCQTKVYNQCVTCKRAGMRCVMGECENIGKRKCPPCNVRKGDRCVHCSFLGLTCVKGECVRSEE